MLLHVVIDVPEVLSPPVFKVVVPLLDNVFCQVLCFSLGVVAELFYSLLPQIIGIDMQFFACSLCLNVELVNLYISEDLLGIPVHLIILYFEITAVVGVFQVGKVNAVVLDPRLL
jgi:hypothetical protein